MPSQNMPPWHKDYSELKTLEKQEVQERHSDLPLLPSKQEQKLLGERFPQEDRNILITRDGSQGENKSVQTDLVKTTL